MREPADSEETKKYVNPRQGRKTFFEVLGEMRKSKWLFSDYPLDLKDDTLHCMVFNLEGWETAFSAWRQGAFSQMLTKEEQLQLKISPSSGVKNIRNVHAVMNKLPHVRKLFMNKVNHKFGVNFSLSENYKGEYDVTPIMKEETLNYRKYNSDAS